MNDQEQVISYLAIVQTEKEYELDSSRSDKELKTMSAKAKAMLKKGKK